jgi:hypothetical protein
LALFKVEQTKHAVEVKYNKARVEDSCKLTFAPTRSSKE